MKSIDIPVHSFVDVITNSSSEIYVTSDRKTIDTIKQMVDGVLKAGGSTSRCDDLFKIVLSRVEDGYGQYNTISVTALNQDNTEAAVCLQALRYAFRAEDIGNS